MVGVITAYKYGPSLSLAGWGWKPLKNVVDPDIEAGMTMRKKTQIVRPAEQEGSGVSSRVPKS